MGCGRGSVRGAHGQQLTFNRFEHSLGVLLAWKLPATVCGVLRVSRVNVGSLRNPAVHHTPLLPDKLKRTNVMKWRSVDRYSNLVDTRPRVAHVIEKRHDIFTSNIIITRSQYTFLNSLGLHSNIYAQAQPFPTTSSSHSSPVQSVCGGLFYCES